MGGPDTQETAWRVSKTCCAPAAMHIDHRQSHGNGGNGCELSYMWQQAMLCDPDLSDSDIHSKPWSVGVADVSMEKRRH